ncbi:nitroreductase family protein [Rhodococcus sp. CX]|uniref:nitroreductase family protein n=1 Tax=Rhodococcus sp. CX TaxID=2789880 RepID=UPI001A23B7E9|nr:nitroreductase family protein [Rhodococcus sp. CX]MBH0123000.1 nitroreductase family protein [Rhodococcus sp. CX]
MFDRSVTVFRSLRRTVAQRFFLAVALADFFGRRAFAREIVAVYAGMRKHHSARRSGREVYYVRRHIHMLEKGISMIPRRETFAAGYIEDLVAAVEACTAADLLDTVTCAWVADTLDAYFAATEESPSPEIRRARETYKQLNVGPRSRNYAGPVPVLDAERAGSERLPTYDELLSLAHARQSVRWFDSKTVDRSLVDRAITLGMQAPSACNRLPYRFVVVDDRDTVRRIAEIPGGTAGYAQNLVGLVVVVGDLSAYAHTRDRHLIYVDSALASMGFLMAMQAQGVSTCCINWPDSADADARIAQILGLQRYERTVMLIAYGHVLPNTVVPGSGKRDLDSIRQYVGNVEGDPR